MIGVQIVGRLLESGCQTLLLRQTVQAEEMR